MSYDKNGLGFMETMLIEMYFPEVFETMANESDEDKLNVYRKTIDAYNEGLI